jgi:hypothetical protein
MTRQVVIVCDSSLLRIRNEPFSAIAIDRAGSGSAAGGDADFSNGSEKMCRHG